ncbi:hypothetical protein L5M43_18495 [Shewanella sp. SW36]|uniref:hypothetical protein n=1 Tax=Shewanella TaxID=22 RepID=UPI0021D824FD|nr:MULTISPECIES: hypothetical protein [unclassified Shewanella]MCU7977211.1 hypothetical protein [Shewanella sp. SW36]MCU7992468.1 hypothetical protein [Shewanella sp. SW1]MCU8053579.1 hypothetical protein [Shewanella sp. SM43]
MSQRHLSKLRVQAEKKLAQLGQKRDDSSLSVQLNQQQNQALTQMILTYRGAKEGSNVLLWQNSASMAQVLEPMRVKLAQKEVFLQQEQLRIDRLWRKQLGRQQGLKWLEKQTHIQEQAQVARREQAVVDDMAGFYYKNKGQ